MQNGKTKTSLWAIALGLTLVVLAAFLLILRFAESEADQNMARWQDRLNLVADSRAAEVSTWLNRHLAHVEELAADASIQLYADQATALDDQTMAQAQRGYIFSFLSAFAERNGFHESRAIDKVAANIKRPKRAGIAILKGDGTPLVGTVGMPVLRPGEWPQDAIGSFIAIGPLLEDKTPLVLFGAPVTSDMAPSTEERAWVIGARPLDEDFLTTLEQPGAQSQTAETYIITQAAEGLVRPITPLKKGGRIGEARLDPAADFAAKEPGGFNIVKNYADTKVLVTGRELSAPVSWVLVRTIEAKEALDDINNRRNSLLITLSLAALFVIAALVLAWRHGVSQKLAGAYDKQAALSQYNETLSKFLRSVSNSQPAGIAALDRNMTVHFANKKIGEITGLPVDELEQRRLDTAFPHETASVMKAGLETALKGKITHTQLDLMVADQHHVFETQFLPLDAEDTSQADVILVMQDVTDLVNAQAQSEHLFRQLVSTLTQIIDARDPWSRHHSVRVAEVAASIAHEMGLEEELIEAVDIAGQLVNLGKIFVPSHILTKETPLTEEELQLVRDSMQKGASLIANLDFKGPVARTLAEMHENWDGSGEPKGLKEGDIEQGARILSVANSFVGMVSARAHRTGLSFDNAMDILQGQAGKRYERRVIASLHSILENKGGRTKWESFGTLTE